MKEQVSFKITKTEEEGPIFQAVEVRMTPDSQMYIRPDECQEELIEWLTGIGLKPVELLLDWETDSYGAYQTWRVENPM